MSKQRCGGGERARVCVWIACGGGRRVEGGQAESGAEWMRGLSVVNGVWRGWAGWEGGGQRAQGWVGAAPGSRRAGGEGTSVPPAPLCCCCCCCPPSSSSTRGSTRSSGRAPRKLGARPTPPHTPPPRCCCCTTGGSSLAAAAAAWGWWGEAPPGGGGATGWARRRGRGVRVGVLSLGRCQRTPQPAELQAACPTHPQPARQGEARAARAPLPAGRAALTSCAAGSPNQWAAGR